MALLVLVSAAVALTAAATSGVLALGGIAVRSAVHRLDAQARVHLWTAVALAPLFLGVLGVAASLLPSFSAVDHCAVHGDHHPHLCFAHANLHRALGAILIASVASVRLIATTLRLIGGAMSASRVAESLSSLSVSPGEVVVVDAPDAFAATFGWWRPRAFVSTAVPAAIRPAVIAHERAHARHRDPAQRAWIELVLAFHLPGIAGVIRRGLHRAQEARADAEAAHEVGDPIAVAEALVGFARLQAGSAAPGAAAFDGDVTARVAELVDPHPRRRLDARLLVASAVAIGALVLSASDMAHHALETVLGWVGA